MQTDTPIFTTTQSALRCAYNFDHAKLKPMHPIPESEKRQRNPEALKMLDMAAQVAMIKNMVADLGRIEECMIICRYATHDATCPHCGNGKIRVKSVTQAIIDLVPIIRREALAGTSARDLATGNYILQYFKPERKRKSFVDLAEKLGHNEKTIRGHISLSFHALHGLEDTAQDRIDRSLRAEGIVGEMD
jgi:hypothetical protein